MIWGIFGIFLKSLDGIFWKKSLEGAKKITTPMALTFLGTLYGLIIALAFLILQFEGNYDFPIKGILLTLLAIVFRFSSSSLVQVVYKNEKLSVLTPYENLNEILAIILAFFIFGGVSITTFCIAIFIIIFTVIYTVDFKNLQFPRFFWRFFISQILTTLYYIFVGLALKEVSYTEYFVLETVLAIVILFFIVIAQKQIFSLWKQTKGFYINKSLSATFGYTGFIIGIYITDKFGLLLSTIFSFLYIVFTLIFSFFFFRDTPKGKDILFSIAITILVTLAVYFK